MRFRCVNGICVAQRLEPETKSIGGIILPDSAQKKSEAALIVESCPSWVKDGRERTTALSPGDVVCISKYSGQEFTITLEGHELPVVLVKEDDILCILDDYPLPIKPVRTRREDVISMLNSVLPGGDLSA